jgi:peptidoglycan hydrolase-like protein with peptidoglycan-binding domain
MAGGQENVREVQEQLKSAGFDPGPVDGVMGPQTQKALRDFQKSKGLKSTGRLDEETRTALLSGGTSGTSGSGGASGSMPGAGSPGSSSGTTSGGATSGGGAGATGGGTTSGSGGGSSTTPGASSGGSTSGSGGTGKSQ